MYLDSHVHTKKFSPDARMLFEDLLKYLSDKDDRYVCITEHYDYDYPKKYTGLCFDPEYYISEYNELKQQYERTSSLTFPILLGAEIGYRNHLTDYYDEFYRKNQFDSVTGSIHTIGDIDPFFERFYYDYGKEKAYAIYLENIAHMIENSDGFDVIGHYDYITRYAPYDDPMMRYEDFKELFDNIFELAIKKNKIFELNTATARTFQKKSMLEYMPDPDVFYRYKEMGGRLVSYGSDAHDASDLFSLYSESMKLLYKTGFRNVCYVKNKEILYYPICISK
jgi:histidinol-phosphatase (PHP family)